MPQTRLSPGAATPSRSSPQSPAMGAYDLSRPQCDELGQLREQYDLKPLVIHTNYLVNLAATNELFLKKSVEAFRGEVERALALCAEYLVLHPGSFRGANREEGLLRTSAAIAAATMQLDLAGAGLTILIENTAGAEYSLGGSFDQVAEVIERSPTSSPSPPASTPATPTSPVTTSRARTAWPRR